MKKIILPSLIAFLLAQCVGVKKNSNKDEATLLLLIQPKTYQVSANISNSGAAMANSMIYFSKATTSTTSASVRATTSTTTSTTTTTPTTTTGSTATTTVDTSPVFETSAQTDDKGNVDFVLTVGDYQAIITGIDNKSQACKIKIENGDIGLSKEGKATVTCEDGKVKVAVIKVSGALSGVTPSSSISFVCGFNPKGDTAPPELTSVELESDKVDLSSGSGKVKVKAKLAEGNEGTATAKKASGIKSVTAKLFSPKRISGSGYSAYATLTLNSTSGLYEGEATLTNFVDNGTWNVGIIAARDIAGNERQYIFDKAKSEKNYSFNGCGQKIDSKITIPTFEVTGSSPDTAAPVLGTVALSSQITGGAAQNPITTSIDISTSTSSVKEAVITVTVTGATDAGGSGIASGISYMDARLQSYSWWQTGSNYLGNAIYVRLELIEGSATNGTFKGSATIRSFAEGSTSADGLWKLGGIWVTDKAGNSLWTDKTTLNKSFTIINASTTANADFYAPELKSISIDKTDVNFDDSFTITADVADTASETTTADQNTSSSSTTSTNETTSTSGTTSTTGTSTTSGTTSTTGTTTTSGTSSTTSLNSSIPSGVKLVKVTLYSPLELLEKSLGLKKEVSLGLNTATGKYEGAATFPSASNQEGGLWKVGLIEVVDVAGNYRVYKLTEGYSYYTYVKLTKTDGDVSSSFNVTNISPASVTRN